MYYVFRVTENTVQESQKNPNVKQHGYVKNVVAKKLLPTWKIGKYIKVNVKWIDGLVIGVKLMDFMKTHIVERMVPMVKIHCVIVVDLVGALVRRVHQVVTL